MLIFMPTFNKLFDMKSIPVLFFFTASTLISCGGTDSKKSGQKDKYENSKETLQQIEQKNPVRFLKAESKDRKNLIGQTVVKGTIYNNAKMASYKDIDLKFSYYSKTGTLLQQDQTVIYDSVAPGKSIDFKTKEFTPKGTSDVKIEIVGAKY